MGDRTEVSSEEAAAGEQRRDLLSALSAVAYGWENGFEIRAEDGYHGNAADADLRRFKIERRKEK